MLNAYALNFTKTAGIDQQILQNDLLLLDIKTIILRFFLSSLQNT
jgi:hypothetical protein